MKKKAILSNGKTSPVQNAVQDISWPSTRIERTVANVIIRNLVQKNRTTCLALLKNLLWLIFDA